MSKLQLIASVDVIPGECCVVGEEIYDDITNICEISAKDRCNNVIITAFIEKCGDRNARDSV